MVIVGNIGNTHSEFAIGCGAELTAPVERISTADLLAGAIPSVVRQNPDMPIWAATVVPAVLELQAFNAVSWVSAQTCKSVDLTRVDASTLGADRIANAAAATTLLTLPVLVMDCGTAITFELIDEARCFLGGAILPGRKLMRTALTAGTAQLPEIPLGGRIPDGVGTTTVDAMRLGIDCGAAGAANAVCKHISRGFGKPLTTHVTGGDSPFFLERMDDTFPVPANFTLIGVSLIAQQ